MSYKVSSVSTALAIASRFASRKLMPPPQGPLSPELTISQQYVRLTINMPVRVEFAPIHHDFPPHDHEFYEINIVTHGTARHYTDKGQETLRAGSVIVVAPGQVHGFTHAKDFGLINIYYLAEWFLGNLQALRGIDQLVPLFFQKALLPQRAPDFIPHFPLGQSDLAGCIEDLQNLNEESLRTDCKPLFLEACLIKCLIRLVRGWSAARLQTDKNAPYTKSETHKEIPASLVTALRLIETDAERGRLLDIGALAATAGVSHSHFCRQFKAHMGMSAGTYFQRYRIHLACHRLLASDLSATEIAHALGYADSAHFSRFFKEITGLSPSAYRKKFAATL